MPTDYTIRTNINTDYTIRTGVVSDLGYLETQLGILCDNDGNMILFNTGIFSSSKTIYNVRTQI